MRLSETEARLADLVDRLATSIVGEGNIILEPGEEWEVDLSSTPPILRFRAADAAVLGEQTLSVTAHEIAHLLHTTPIDYDPAVLGWDILGQQGLAQLLVFAVEDARIERMFSAQFPGARSLFTAKATDQWSAKALRGFPSLPAKWRFLLNASRALNGMPPLGTDEDKAALGRCEKELQMASLGETTQDLACALAVPFTELIGMVKAEQRAKEEAAQRAEAEAQQRAAERAAEKAAQEAVQREQEAQAHALEDARAAGNEMREQLNDKDEDEREDQDSADNDPDNELHGSGDDVHAESEAADSGDDYSDGTQAEAGEGLDDSDTGEGEAGDSSDDDDASDLDYGSSEPSSGEEASNDVSSDDEDPADDSSDAGEEAEGLDGSEPGASSEHGYDEGDSYDDQQQSSGSTGNSDGSNDDGGMSDPNLASPDSRSSGGSNLDGGSVDNGSFNGSGTTSNRNVGTDADDDWSGESNASDDRAEDPDAEYDHDDSSGTGDVSGDDEDEYGSGYDGHDGDGEGRSVDDPDSDDFDPAEFLDDVQAEADDQDLLERALGTPDITQDVRATNLMEEMIANLRSDEDHKKNPFIVEKRNQMDKRAKEARRIEREIKVEQLATLEEFAEDFGVDGSDPKALTNLRDAIARHSHIYDRALGDLRPEINTLRRYAGQVLKENRLTRYSGSYDRGRKIKTRRLYRMMQEDPRIFERELQLGGKSYAVAMSVDQSGSMGGLRAGSNQVLAFQAAVIMAEAFEGIIQTAVLGFSTSFPTYRQGRRRRRDMWGRPVRETVESNARVYKGIDDDLIKRTALMAEMTGSYGTTPTADGHQAAVQEVMSSDAEVKVVIIITDGHPNHDQWPILINQIHEARRQGIETFCLRVGQSGDDIIRIGARWDYEGEAVNVHDLFTVLVDVDQAQEIPNAVLAMLRQIVKRNLGAAV